MKEIIMKQEADERFYPREFKIPFGPFIRHYERYFQSVKILNKTGKQENWLDCACGSGYGTNLLSNFTDKVVGYDIDSLAIEAANENYKNQHCHFVNDISNIKEHFDVIFSIETIEHMPTQQAPIFLKTLNSAMKKHGDLIITTPIVKKTNYKPTNIYHHIEYSDEDFKVLLENSNFEIIETKFIETTFTDGETKFQGYYKCRKTNA
jgi:2-polyprenyl-3-methyl-5-hydroxy-6-metoxy-1,4-benzoquinol methylase